jgi:hypothetical protein
MSIPPEKKFALLIGCNYVGTSNQLFGCQNDVVLFSELLINKFGYHRENVILLIEKTGYLSPNYQNIINSINDLISKSISRQALDILFYYSGHGSSITDTSGDEPDRRDEVIIPLDFRTRGIISDDYLYDNFILKINRLTKLFFIFDSCNSASCADLPISYEVFPQRSLLKRSLSKRKLSNIKIFSLSGCYDSSFSYEYWDPELKLSVGALSYFIRQVLKNNNYVCYLDRLLLDLDKCFTTNRINQKPILSLGGEIRISTVKFL